MLDITHKTTTLRQATAKAEVEVSKEETIDAVKNKEVPKGDVLEAARVAGLYGVKRTSDMIPDCHPMPVEHAEVNFEYGDNKIFIEMHVKTIYRTGVEVESMHGASVVALTIYDMLKPIDKGVKVKNIELKEKKGGMSDYRKKFKEELSACVIVCSDTISKGKKEDKAGIAIKEELEENSVEVKNYEIIPDDPDEINKKASEAEKANYDLLIFSGGTGLSPRDFTPDTLKPLLDREIPGISEAIRAYGQERTPYSMLSRSLAGVIN
ncbi:MAG: bifunctional molybdenum cofactor biosynthesis protein MoaC/MoaB, partial [Flavobacteriales bacterium]